MKDQEAFTQWLEAPEPGQPTPEPFTEEDEAAGFMALYAQVNGGDGTPPP